LTFLYVRHEWTYDAFHENANRIYRVYAEFQAPNKKVYRIPTLQTAFLRYALLDERWQGWGEGKGEQGQVVRTKRFYVDYDFVKTFEMKVLTGRDFDPYAGDQTKGGVLVNQAFVKQMGWNAPIGQRVDFGPRARSLRKSNSVAEVIGVVKDFNLMPLQQKVQPATLLPISHIILLYNCL
jgi:hypothetical protein